MAFNGLQNFSVIPAGRSTTLSTKSNWPHPGFDGRFLPESRNITDAGFEAQWTIPNCQGYRFRVGFFQPGTQMRVNFIEPLKFYQILPVH